MQKPKFSFEDGVAAGYFDPEDRHDYELAERLTARDRRCGYIFAGGFAFMIYVVFMAGILAHSLMHR